MLYFVAHWTYHPSSLVDLYTIVVPVLAPGLMLLIENRDKQ